MAGDAPAAELPSTLPPGFRFHPTDQELPSTLPPGFRFHPTDQELINSYLSRKVLGLHPQLNFIPEVDVYNYEPSELPDKSFSLNRDEDDPCVKVEFYLFVPRGRNYPTGSRMKRATRAGFWKSTGKDRPILHHHIVIGMKKTLVYPLGRAPHGMRTDWVMHEYRLHNDNSIQDTYLLCRVFNKNAMTGDGEVNKEGMHFIIGGGHEDNGVTLLVTDGAGADKDGMQSMPVGANEKKQVMQFMNKITDLDNDVMQPMPDGPEEDMGGMAFIPNEAGTNKGHIQRVHGGANTYNDVMQFLFGGDDAGNSCMQFMSDTGLYTNALMEEDNSWMQIYDGACYPSAN